MNKFKFIFLFLLFILMGGKVFKVYGDESKKFQSITTQELGALSVQEYLDLLGRSKKGWLTISGEVMNWPDYKDISYLLDRLNDESFCMSVNSQYSSYIDSGQSNISTEVKYILLGLKEGRFPPRLNSSAVKNEDLNQAVEWAKEKVQNRSIP